MKSLIANRLHAFPLTPALSLGENGSPEGLTGWMTGMIEWLPAKAAEGRRTPGRSARFGWGATGGSRGFSKLFSASKEKRMRPYKDAGNDKEFL
jgi:hypothetical protein